MCSYTYHTTSKKSIVDHKAFIQPPLFLPKLFALLIHIALQYERSRPYEPRRNGPWRDGHAFQSPDVQHERKYSFELPLLQIIFQPLTAHHQMLFTWDTTNLCIVFRQWHVYSTLGLIASLFGIVLLTAGYELVREASRRYEASSAEYMNKLPSMFYLPQSYFNTACMKRRG